MARYVIINREKFEQSVADLGGIIADGLVIINGEVVGEISNSILDLDTDIRLEGIEEVQAKQENQNTRLNPALIITDFDHGAAVLAHMTGLSEDDVLRSIGQYRHFYIRKRNGKKRSIWAPLPKLKAIQKALHDIIAPQIDSIAHPRAMAYVRGRGIKDIVKLVEPIHPNFDLYKIDLQVFFEQITFVHIRDAIKELLRWPEPGAKFVAAVATNNSTMVQGSILSPSLSNLVMVNTDRALNDIANRYEALYVRYSDDILIFARPGDSRPYKDIVAKLKEFGWRINEKKSGIRKIKKALGISFAGKTIQPTRELRRQSRLMRHVFEKYGTSAEVALHFVSSSLEARSWLSKLNWAAMINEEHKRTRELFYKAIKNAGLL